MKQFNYEFKNVKDVAAALSEVSSYTADYPYRSILFHLYSMMFDDDQISEVQSEILDLFPDARIGGTSSNGDICDGHLEDYGMVMAVSVFETTETATYLFECENGQESVVGGKIRYIIDNTEGIRAAEILITLKSINSKTVLEEVESCNEKVKIFGGGSAGPNISDTDTKVINEKAISHSGVILITYSGEDFKVDIHNAIGWKPLGRDLKATKIEGKRLYELDGVPAAQIYSKYLDIQADEDFSNNILEFPIMTWQNGQSVLRLPFSCNSEDGSIILAAALDEGAKVNLSYGDPEVIRGDVTELLETVKNFAPQAIFLYSCGVRRLYWKYLINKETGPFSKLAPVCGYYSSGEIMRAEKKILEHHVTLIAISMREGGHADAQPTGIGDKKIEMSEEQKIHGQISMVRRLANFINVTAAELRAANEELQEMADTDALTGLNNRRILDNTVRTALIHAETFGIKLAIGIIDIDDFKYVNDTYGYAVGDEVLVTVAKLLDKEISKTRSAVIGRWGGEEFLFILPNLEIEEARLRVESIREKIERNDFGDIGTRTVSIGMTSYAPGDSADDVFQRADAALYEAKGTGKNRVCINER